MKKLLLMLTLAAFIGGCASSDDKDDEPIREIGCTLGKAVARGVSIKLKDELQCESYQPILDDMISGLRAIKLCEKESLNMALKRAGGDGIVLATDIEGHSFKAQICFDLSSMMLDILTTPKLIEWKCEGELTRERVMEKIKDACDKLDNI